MFDEQRISDLQSMQSEIIIFWQSKDRLPETLNELGDDIRGVIIPTDPETKEKYTYRVLGDTTFELCAIFNIDSNSDVGLRGVRPHKPQYQENWEHGAGTTCFKRHIDKELYNKNNPSLPRQFML